MKTISKLLLSIFIITLISCDSDEQATSAAGDVYMISKATETDTIYGLSLNAVSNKNFTSVSASPVDDIDVSYQLSVYQGRYYNFVYETNETNFGTTIPQTGTYTFSATIENGENLTFSDDLSDDIIYPPSIIECQFDDTNENIEIEWEDDEDVDVYNVKVYTDSGTLVFAGPGINPDTDNYSFDASTGGWLNNYSPIDNDVYTVEVNAYLYETVIADMNFQCISMNTHDVTWGVQ